MRFNLASWKDVREWPLWRKIAGADWRRHRPAFLTGRMREGMSPVLLALGGLLLGYVGVQYGHMYFEQRQLQQEWHKQQQAREIRPSSSHPVKASSVDDGLTRLTVPRIDLDSVVVEGTSHHALLLGPGHLRNTPAPGEIGNSVISGHRDTFFRHIHELEKGDLVIVQRNGTSYRYEVTGRKIVEPDDLSVIRTAKDSELTLITCYPTYYVGPAPKRLVVFSKLVGEQNAATQAAAAAGH